MEHMADMQPEMADRLSGAGRQLESIKNEMI